MKYLIAIDNFMNNLHIEATRGVAAYIIIMTTLGTVVGVIEWAKLLKGFIELTLKLTGVSQ